MVLSPGLVIEGDFRVVAPRNHLPPAEVAEIAAQLGHALTAAYAAHVVHRERSGTAMPAPAMAELVEAIERFCER